MRSLDSVPGFRVPLRIVEDHNIIKLPRDNLLTFLNAQQPHEEIFKIDHKPLHPVTNIENPSNAYVGVEDVDGLIVPFTQQMASAEEIQKIVARRKKKIRINKTLQQKYNAHEKRKYNRIMLGKDLKPEKKKEQKGEAKEVKQPTVNIADPPKEVGLPNLGNKKEDESLAPQFVESPEGKRQI